MISGVYVARILRACQQQQEGASKKSCASQAPKYSHKYVCHRGHTNTLSDQSASFSRMTTQDLVSLQLTPPHTPTATPLLLSHTCSHFCEEHKSKIKEEPSRLLSDVHALSPGASHEMKRRLTFKVLLPMLWDAGRRIVRVWLDDSLDGILH